MLFGTGTVCERISEVDEDEEEDTITSPPPASGYSGRDAASSTPSSYSVTPSETRSGATSTSRHDPLGEDREDATLADLSAVSSLSGLSSGSGWDFDRDLVGEDESLEGVAVALPTPPRVTLQRKVGRRPGR